MTSTPRTSRARSRPPRTLQWTLRVTPTEPATPWVGGCCQACDGGCPPRTLQWTLRVTPTEPATPWVGGCCQACDGGCPAPAQVHARMPPRRARH